MGVVKHIIPAIASTNAFVSSVCVNEAFKLATYCGKVLDNYLMYMGQDGVYVDTVALEKKPNCIICSNGLTNFTVDSDCTLANLIEKLKTNYLLTNPSITCEKKGLIYIPAPPVLEEVHHFKLSLTVQ